MDNMTLEEALAAADVSTTPVNDILMVDAEARTIIVPASEMLFGVRQDMDAERKHFKCPKIVGDNVDLSNCHIYISYVPSKQDGTYDINEDVGAYLCEDLDVDGDYVTFSWKLSGNVFVKAGYIAFAVYAKQADADGNLQTKWHTTFAIGKVLDTLPDGEQIVEKYADVIEQLLNRMDEVEAIATPEAMQNYIEAYLVENPPSGMTAEEKEQLDKNTEDISSLSEEIANLDVRSIADIQKTASELLVDTYTITYTDGTSSTFQVTNGSSDEAYIASVIRAWLDEHPEATTTVQNGVITYEKLADDVKEVIDKASKSGGGYKYEYIGCPFPALDNYQSWPIAGVQYDKARDRIICLVTDADQHVNATKYRLNLYSLNPVTSEIKLIKTLKDNTVEPAISISDAFGSQRGFLIDNDTGIYYKFHFGDDKIPYACKSEDSGCTWTDIEISESNSSDILFGGGNGCIIKTTSGRIICGLFCNGFAYTDDYFQTLTYVTSGKVSVDGVASAHEYEIIEYETGKLVAIMRKTWQSRAGEVWSGAKRIEPALLAYSEDNGTTWSFPVESTSIKNMSATNCVSFIHGDTLDLYVGCRYPVFADKVSAMFRYTASLADISNDDFEFKETMFYGNTAEYIDFGNLAGCIDSVGNYHLFYNDDMDSKCRWHYIKICKVTDNNSGIQEEPKNKWVQTYNAVSIDTLLNMVYKHISNVKNELLLKIGELPDYGDIDNPTYWVTDGLLALFKFTEDYFDTSTSAFSPMYGGESYNNALIYTSLADGTFSVNSLISSKSTIKDDFANLIQNALLDSDGYTIEIDMVSSPADASGNDTTFVIWGNVLLRVRSIQISQFSTTTAKTYSALGEYSFTAGEKGIYDDNRNVNTFTWAFDRANQKACAYLNGILVLDSNDFIVTDGYSLDIADYYGIDTFKNWKQYDWTEYFKMGKGDKSALRFYNRALTAEEVKANAIYSNS